MCGHEAPSRAAALPGRAGRACPGCRSDTPIRQVGESGPSHRPGCARRRRTGRPHVSPPGRCAAGSHRPPHLPHAAAELIVEHVVGISLDPRGRGVAINRYPVVTDQMKALLPWVQPAPPAIHQLGAGDRRGRAAVEAGEVNQRRGAEQLLAASQSFASTASKIASTNWMMSLRSSPAIADPMLLTVRPRRQRPPPRRAPIRSPGREGSGRQMQAALPAMSTINSRAAADRLAAYAYSARSATTHELAHRAADRHGRSGLCDDQPADTD